MNHGLQVNRGTGRLEALPINRVARNEHVQQRGQEALASWTLLIDRVAHNSEGAKELTQRSSRCNPGNDGTTHANGKHGSRM